jgi:hypothetical protein
MAVESGTSLSLALLAHVVHGQSQRTILEDSKDKYLGKVKVMTGILNKNVELRRLSLMCSDESIMTDNPQALKHTGIAAKVYKLILPMPEEAAKYLFAAISIDETLPKRRKRKQLNNPDDEDQVEVGAEPVDPRNPAKNKVTVTAQTYQNYKSALKWWHRFDCPEMDKVGHILSAKTEEAIDQAIASYKKDIGIKKRRGIMSQKEGKSKYNLFFTLSVR